MYRKLALAVVVFLACLASCVADSWRIDHALQNDAAIQAQFATMSANSRALLDALNGYRAQHGLYPPNLRAFEGRSPAMKEAARTFLYRAEAPDQVFNSPACEAEQGKFSGWIMKSALEFEREKAEFNARCVKGFREASLQSPNFSQSPQSVLRNSEVWAYYSTKSAQWAIGHCDHRRANGRESGTSSTNGVCRDPRLVMQLRAAPGKTARVEGRAPD